MHVQESGVFRYKRQTLTRLVGHSRAKDVIFQHYFHTHETFTRKHT